MSKEMDALERLISLAAYGSACVEASCKEPECIEAKTALALLRDYITTTEAGRAGVIKGQELSAGQIMDAMKCGTMACAECSMRPAWAKWSCIEYLARDLTASAARIKELEEALAKHTAEWQLCPMCLGYKNVRNIDPVTTSTWNPDRVCPVCGGAGVILPLSETVALSGARKVES